MPGMEVATHFIFSPAHVRHAELRGCRFRFAPATGVVLPPPSGVSLLRLRGVSGGLAVVVSMTVDRAHRP